MQNNRNLHVNFSLIARELGISVMTIYRVINNAPHVSGKMRAAVIKRLNAYGFFSRSNPVERRILFDFSDHPYLFWLGKRLQALFPNTAESNHRKNAMNFFNAASLADTVVFLRRTLDYDCHHGRCGNHDQSGNGVAQTNPVDRQHAAESHFGGKKPYYARSA